MASVKRTPGTSGWPGKWPSNTGLWSGTVAVASIRFALRSRRSTRSIISKVSRRMGAGRTASGEEPNPYSLLAIRSSSRLRALRRDERVDAGGEVAQDEVLLGRHLALVHLLRPLLQRQLDAERLVDGEGDVEKGQRIDAEVVDGVGLRRDLVPRDVRGFGDDAGHGVEGGRHRAGSPSFCAGWSSAHTRGGWNRQRPCRR